METVNEAGKLAGDWDLGVLESLALLAKRCMDGVKDKRKYCNH